jgi:hypothetical protein
MAKRSQIISSFALPNDVQAVALRIAAEDRTLVGTQTAASPPGCPPRSRDTTPVATIAKSMLSRAVRCEGPVAVGDRVAET